MTRHTAQSKLTQFDLMMIRAGGRTQAEFADMAESGFGFSVRCKVFSVFADLLYHIVIKLEAGANRAWEDSHRRLEAKSMCDSYDSRTG